MENDMFGNMNVLEANVVTCFLGFIDVHELRDAWLFEVSIKLDLKLIFQTNFQTS